MKRKHFIAGFRAVARLVILSVLLTAPFSHARLAGQRFTSMEQAEDTLYSILAALNQAQGDSLKALLNRDFAVNLADALTLPSSAGFPFDSLKRLVKIASPDGKFRILHWNLPGDDGKHHFYGFMQVTGHEPPRVYPLTDWSDSIPFPDTAYLDNRRWYGALYYKIIPEQTDAGQPFYTLIGWAGKTSRITSKVIEILWFDDREQPRFGMKIFPGFQDGTRTRAIFRYSSSTSMAMKYELRMIETSRKWNKSRRAFDQTMGEAPMIVVDRLVPPDPNLEGQYQYYVASGDIYDGFVFRKGTWTYVPDIDAWNKK